MILFQHLFLRRMFLRTTTTDEHNCQGYPNTQTKSIDVVDIVVSSYKDILAN